MQGTYTLASSAWPSEVNRFEDNKVDRLMISGEDGDEISVDWYMLAPYGTVPQVSAFSEGWGLLAWLLSALGGRELNPEAMIELLDSKGFKPSEYHGQMHSGRWVSAATRES